jgi:hypothetical protein
LWEDEVGKTMSARGGSSLTGGGGMGVCSGYV